MSSTNVPLRPIFVLGAARSGTTIVADVIATHPHIAYWVEPKYVWRHGAHGSRHDARDASEATPEVARHIRHTFGRFLHRSACPRFLEKTPSNCFRVEFMHRIFPDALFLHVQRDGRDVAASALLRWCSPPDDGALLRRLKRFEMPLAAAPLYIGDILREAMLRRLQPGRGHLWGPRYPGIHEDLASGMPVARICARQWARSALAAAEGLRRIPAHQQLSFRYEDFVKDPGPLIARIEDFAGLPRTSHLRDAASALLRRDRGGGFARLPADVQSLIASECRDAMESIGTHAAG